MSQGDDDFDSLIDWYALSNGLSTVMPDGTLVHGIDDEIKPDPVTGKFVEDTP